jgi:hypothetical protein
MADLKDNQLILKYLPDYQLNQIPDREVDYNVWKLTYTNIMQNICSI